MDDMQNQTQPQEEKKSKTTLLIIIALIILALLFGMRSFFSPDRVAERMLEQATGGKVDIDRDGETVNTTVVGDDGSKMNISSGNTSLPDGWPASVPVIPDAKVASSASAPNSDGGTAYTVSYETDMSVADAVSFYKDAFSRDGWTITATLNQGDGTMFVASRGEEDGATVQIGSGDQGTSVNMSVQVKE